MKQGRKMKKRERIRSKKNSLTIIRGVLLQAGVEVSEHSLAVELTLTRHDSSLDEFGRPCCRRQTEPVNKALACLWTTQRTFCLFVCLIILKFNTTHILCMTVSPSLN